MRTYLLLALLAAPAHALSSFGPPTRRHSTYILRAITSPAESCAPLAGAVSGHPEGTPKAAYAESEADLEGLIPARAAETDVQAEERAEEFWVSCGIKSKSRIRSLIKFGRRAPTRNFDLKLMRERLEDIAKATRLGSVEEAADLVSRAPSLLGNRPDTLAKKVVILESYFEDVDIIRMIWKQPTLLARDIENTMVRNIMSLEEIFGDTTARMVEWQPHIMFIQHEKLKEHAEKLIDLIIGTGELGNANGSNGRAEAIFILSRAPSLLVYRFDTVESTLEAWSNLLPGTTLSKVWRKMPSILHSDVVNTVMPKIRILQGILSSPDDDIFVSPVTALVESNPSFLAYSREKYTRLLYQSTFSRVDASGVRRTLKTDAGLGKWIERTGVNASDYATWLRGRLQRSRIAYSSEDIALLEKANGVALAQIELTEARVSFDSDFR
jgi:hypothetical protein